MSYAAYLPLVADRVGPCVRTVRFHGIDLTDVPLRLQWRLRADTPGAPLGDLTTVSVANAEGLRLIDVSTGSGTPVSTVVLRINEATMKDATKVPYMGEVGDAAELAYDWIGTFGQDKRMLARGPLIADASVNGADNAPLNRAANGALRSGGGAFPAWTNADLTFGENVVEVRVDGLDAIAAAAVRAEGAANRAETNIAIGITNGVALAIGASQANADAAGVSAVRAEVARDAAMAGAVQYTDVATGLAATVEGKAFTVVSADLTFATAYRKTGGVAVFLNDLPSVAGVKAMVPVDNLHTFPGATDSDKLDAALALAATRPMRLRLAAGRGLFAGNAFTDAGAYNLTRAHAHPGRYSFELIGDGESTVVRFAVANARIAYNGTYAGSQIAANGHVLNEWFGARDLRLVFAANNVATLLFANFKFQKSQLISQCSFVDLRIEPECYLKSNDPAGAGINMTCLAPIRIRNGWSPRVKRIHAWQRANYGVQTEIEVNTACISLEGQCVGTDIERSVIWWHDRGVRVRPYQMTGIVATVTAGTLNRGDTITQGAASGKLAVPDGYFGWTVVADEVTGSFAPGAAMTSAGATLNITSVGVVAKPSESVNLVRTEFVQCVVMLDIDSASVPGGTTFPQGSALLATISRCHGNFYQNAIRARGVSCLNMDGNQLEARLASSEFVSLDYAGVTVIRGNKFIGVAGGSQTGIRMGETVNFVSEHGNIMTGMVKSLRLSATTRNGKFGPSVYNATTSDHIENLAPTTGNNIFVGGGDASLDGLNSLSDRTSYTYWRRGDGATYTLSVDPNASTFSPAPMHQIRLAAPVTSANASTSQVYGIKTDNGAVDTFFVTPNGRLYARNRVETGVLSAQSAALSGAAGLATLQITVTDGGTTNDWGGGAAMSITRSPPKSLAGSDGAQVLRIRTNGGTETNWFVSASGLTWGGGVRFLSDSKGIFESSGSPEGLVVAPRGSLCLASNPPAGQPVIYAKMSGAGATGWQGLT